MIERFLKEKDLLTEIWSPFVKGSEDGAKSLVIGDLIKKTDKFELYKATNLSGSLNFDIIVYLDDNVKPEGQCLLGQVKRSDYYSYEESKQLSCVFEIKGNWEEYISSMRERGKALSDLPTVDEFGRRYDEFEDEDTRTRHSHTYCGT